MDRIITITLGDPATKALTLSDQGTTNVDPGDQVTWVIGANSGVASIRVQEKPDSTDVFNPDPAPIANSTSWMGTVNPNISGGTERYNIFWVPVGTTWSGAGNGELQFDPIIKVNSR